MWLTCDQFELIGCFKDTCIRIDPYYLSDFDCLGGLDEPCENVYFSESMYCDFVHGFNF